MRRFHEAGAAPATLAVREILADSAGAHWSATTYLDGATFRATAINDLGNRFGLPTTGADTQPYRCIYERVR